MKSNLRKRKTGGQDGQLLLEILVAVAVVSVIAVLSANLVYVSMVGNKLSGEKNAAAGLSEETFEAVRNIASERWQNIYDLSKFSVNYYPTSTSGKWETAAGTESVAVSGIIYSRSFTVQNVCRDNASRDVVGVTDSDGTATTCVVSGGSHDPSTQKINTTISWPDAEPVASSEYITRWRNKACVQTDWSGGTGSGTTTCPSSAHGGSSNMDTSGGTLKLTP